jgi:hypothetical protein
MTTQEEDAVADRSWLLNYLPLTVGVLVLGLMGWGLFEGASSLIRKLQPAQSGDASIALSASFVRPPAAPVPAAATATPQTVEPTSPAVSTAPATTAATDPAIKEKPKKKAAAPPPLFEIRGSVQRAGLPVQRGKVRLTVSLVGERFRQSTLTDLDRNGDFLVRDHPAFRSLEPLKRIRVEAEVWPVMRPGAQADAPLTETIYLNHPLPSWIRSSTGYAALAGVLLFAALFLWAFTGRSTYAKNRLAIILSYSVIFLSLAGALVGPTLLMLAVPDLPDISGKVPVGLVVAKLTEDSKPQWMLNIGGYVDGGGAVPKGVPFRVEGESSGEGDDLGSPVLRIVTLNGGIQIPLYVILLALIGGAINMTRQVPDFQSRQPDFQSRQRVGFLHRMPWGITPEEDQKENVPWRKGLLDQYMFLIAAPFLAIATYYLLILLGTIQPPIIVLVCFSIGLISDTVVTAITGAAKKLLGGKTVKEEQPEQPPLAHHAPEPVSPAAATAIHAVEGAATAEESKKAA